MPFIIVFAALIMLVMYLMMSRRRNAAAARQAVIMHHAAPEPNPVPTPIIQAEVAMLPDYYTRFNMKFDNQNIAQAVHVPVDSNTDKVIELLGVRQTPTILITGGASQMSPDDIQRVEEIIDAVATFAQQRGVTILDGGTESGVMQMIGEARRKHNHTFQLVGVSPIGKVSFPGYKNPSEEGFLEDSHTHFVLVDGKDWGDESTTLLSLIHAVSNHGEFPAVGLLINGGQIAKQEVYLAATKKFHLPMIVLDGSGRAADDIATAFKTGRTNQRILQAILQGGDIQLVAASEGPDAVCRKLLSRLSR